MTSQVLPVGDDPIDALKRLCIAAGGDWLENDRAAGFTVTGDRQSLEVQYLFDTDTIRVSGDLGVGPMFISEWLAPADTCHVAQYPDDGNLLTELTTDENGGGREQRCFWWGPPARYRGGNIKLNPDVDEDQHLLQDIDPDDVDA